MLDQTPPAPRRPRLRTALVALGAAALVAAAAVLAPSLAPRNGAELVDACRPALETAARLAPTARGEVAAVVVHDVPRPAPEAEFVGPDGAPTSLADFRGRTVLVNLWATWCAPCREEMPALDALQAEFGGPDFEVVAINLDTRNLDRPRVWLAENGIDDLAFYAEHRGVLMQRLQRTGHVIGLPTSILVGPEGCELGLLKGYAAWASEDGRAMIRAALGRP